MTLARQGRASQRSLMRTRAHLRSARAGQLWSRRIWPLTAGAVTAVGVFAAGNALGMLALVLVYAALSMFAVAMVWGLSLENGMDLSSTVRWGLLAALVVLVTVGLCEVHQVYGLLAGVAVGVTSPTALALVSKVNPRRRQPPTDRTARPAPGVLVDKAMIDRRFHDIVSQWAESDEFPAD
jgi:hypothetical protein